MTAAHRSERVSLPASRPGGGEVVEAPEGRGQKVAARCRADSEEAVEGRGGGQCFSFCFCPNIIKSPTRFSTK